MTYSLLKTNASVLRMLAGIACNPSGHLRIFLLIYLYFLITVDFSNKEYVVTPPLEEKEALKPYPES